MLNAKDIIGLIPQGGSLVLNFTVIEGKLAVMVNPRHAIKTSSEMNGAKEAIETAMKPRFVTGTPDELDGNFMGLLKQVVESQNTLVAAIADVEKATKEAIEKVKAEGGKKVEEAKKTAAAKAKTVQSAKAGTVVSRAVLPPAAITGTSEVELEEEGGAESAEEKETAEIEAAEAPAAGGVQGEAQVVAAGGQEGIPGAEVKVEAPKEEKKEVPAQASFELF